MSITLDLPPPINDELTQESQREGISEREHAALLVCLAFAFRKDEPTTPFQNAVRDFLTHRSLDAERVFSVFEELVRVCLDVQDIGKSSKEIQSLANAITRSDYELLKHWRNATVHQSAPGRPLDVNPDAFNAHRPLLDIIVQSQGQTYREADSVDKSSDPRNRVSSLLARWQAEDRTPLRPPVPTHPGETPTQALFRKWAEEDANMTEEEKEAEDRLWENIEKGIKEGRLELRTKRIAS